MHRLLTFFLTVALYIPAHADVIHIPVGQQGSAEMAMPNRGDSRNQVLDRFGLADQEHPAVGQPPITRWDYREFSVYFEGNRVINSVQHHQRTTPIQRGIQP